jgi:hypothetical protein
MSHFAKIEDGIVTQVIVAEQEFIDSGVLGDPSGWVQTSYNGSLRKRYAGIGYLYIQEIDAFIPPKPFDSWILNEQEFIWKAPIDYPTDGKNYVWNEELQEWIEAQGIIPIKEEEEKN